MPLTADLCARAIIAAARAFGTDPVRAVTDHPRSRHRKALTAAGAALRRTLETPWADLERVLQVKQHTVGTVRAKPGFLAGELAAARAIEFATWRPEAAESVAGGAGTDEVGAPMASPEPQAAAAKPQTLPRQPGPITAEARLFAARAVPSLPPLERPLADRILDVLAEGSATAIGLASILGAKELLVGQSLNVLMQAGAIVAGEIPAEGPRHRRWQLTAQEAA
ncbi:hypothetical protein [Phenylobacterium sp.]|uniref:hypothetical protein n=1 Tax=Phenylobacterium sp. TaxID=1871053 RepID=UPI00391A1E4A